jgi:hypothetical protein
MKPITIIWAIFAILFFLFGLFHIRAAGRNIAPFEIKAKGSVGKINGIPVHTGFKNFVNDFNSYIRTQNKSTRNENIMAAIGYFAASLTAVFSMFITIERISNPLNKIFEKRYIAKLKKHRSK